MARCRHQRVTTTHEHISLKIHPTTNCSKRHTYTLHRCALCCTMFTHLIPQIPHQQTNCNPCFSTIQNVLPLPLPDPFGLDSFSSKKTQRCTARRSKGVCVCVCVWCWVLLEGGGGEEEGQSVQGKDFILEVASTKKHTLGICIRVLSFVLLFAFSEIGLLDK